MLPAKASRPSTHIPMRASLIHGDCGRLPSGSLGDGTDSGQDGDDRDHIYIDQIILRPVGL